MLTREGGRANVLATDNKGFNALHVLCCAGNHVACARLVVEAARGKLDETVTDDEADAETPLHLACLTGHRKMVEYLVKERDVFSSA